MLTSTRAGGFSNALRRDPVAIGRELLGERRVFLLERFEPRLHALDLEDELGQPGRCVGFLCTLPELSDLDILHHEREPSRTAFAPTIGPWSNYEVVLPHEPP